MSSPVYMKMPAREFGRAHFNGEDDEISFIGSPSEMTSGSHSQRIIFKRGIIRWSRWSTFERALLIVTCVLLVTVFILIGVLVARKDKQKNVTINLHNGSRLFHALRGGKRNHLGSVTYHAEPCPIQTTTAPSPKEQPEEFCLTPECITVTSSILAALDTSVDPCHDFYQYACGGWVKAHPVPTGKSQWGTFGQLRQENQLVMKVALEQPDNGSAGEAEKKAQRYYMSCVDVNSTREQLGAQPLLDLISRLGGWAVSTASPPGQLETWSLESLLADLQLLGIAAPFKMWVSQDDKNTSRNIIQLDQGGLMLGSREYYINRTADEDKIIDAIHVFLTTVGTLLGGEENKTSDMMVDVLEFETELANISAPRAERLDMEKLYTVFTVKQLQEQAPFIHWLTFLKLVMGPAGLEITEDEPIIVYEMSYLRKLTAFLENMLASAPGKMLFRTYLISHLVEGMSVYLDKRFVAARQTLSEALSGQVGAEEDWRFCVSDTDNVLGFALGAMFVRRVFNSESKDKAEVMIQEIKEAFISGLPDLEWLDQETRIKAVDKARAIIDMIGFPPYILDSSLLEDRYAGLEVSANEYFNNNLRAMQFEWLRDIKKLRNPPEKYPWVMTPATVNAYYTPTKNEIVFPAGILQTPFYDPGYPKSLNFGGMGVVMGHELTHGFDDQGREYDKFGNMHKWWNNGSIERFKDHAQCLVDQYSQYSVEGTKLKGQQTLGENIADNGGLKTAFKAYESWVTSHGQEDPLPALQLSPKQLFFVGFAQVWCSTATPEAALLGLRSDSHSPAKYRVIGTVSNSEEFADTFGCPANSPMNPSKKCVVW